MTTHPAEDVTPTWSRDGRSIYFASNRSGEFQTWKISVEGDEPKQIKTLEAPAIPLAFAVSPDERWFLVSGTESGRNSDIMLVENFR